MVLSLKCWRKKNFCVYWGIGLLFSFSDQDLVLEIHIIATQNFSRKCDFSRALSPNLHINPEKLVTLASTEAQSLYRKQMVMLENEPKTAAQTVLLATM